MKKERKGLEPYPYLGETFFQKVCGIGILAITYLVGQVYRASSFCVKTCRKTFGSKKNSETDG